jgi:DNA ligase-associated metallophosphoesterase
LPAKKLPAPFRFKFHRQTLWLSASRCIFWEEESVLIVSDLHFGKSGHFRKSGIGIPQHIFKNDLQRLFSQIEFFKPKILLVTGDMFHSTANKELDLFLKWRNDISYVGFYLVRGNHDILNRGFYKKADIQVFTNKLSVGNFCFTHDGASACDDEKLFIFSGHTHPGIKMNGLAAQSLMLPCFYFGKKYAILPAFSQFTGLSKIKPLANDHVFAIVENEIIKIQ